MKFKHYIWDFDGCLCDSYPNTTKIFLRAMQECGRTVLPPENEVFLHLQVTWKHAREFFGMTDEEYALLYKFNDDNFFDEPTPVLFPGIRDTLEAIVKAGGHNYLYTLRNRLALEALERFGVTDLFTDFVIEEDGFPGKPAPDAVRHIMEKHHLSPAETVMIGDRDLDGLSGVNAGTNGCLLTFLEKNCNGEDPLDVTKMTLKCRGVAAFRALMEI